MKRYPAYKPSDVQWLGEIPDHWEVRRLKYIVDFVSRGNAPDYVEQSDVCAVSQGCVQRDGLHLENVKFHGGSADGFKGLLKDGDLLINSTGTGTLGRCSIFAKEDDDAHVYFADGHVTILRDTTTSINPDYLYSFFRTRQEEITVFASEGATNQIELQRERLRSFSLPLPDIDEQTAIVSYLDRKNAEIDGFVASKRKLIALLNEERAAFIQKIVLRGLNPDAPMKQTGVDWLGEVPAHWEVRRNISLFGQRIERGSAELPILVVSLHTGVTVGDEDSADAPQRLIEDRTAYKRTNSGDIAYNMMRMWQGAVGVTPVDGLVSPAYVVAYPLANVDSRFYCYLFRTDVYKNEVNRQSRGIVSDRNRLYWQDFKQMLSPFPPLSEQQAIVAEIEEQSQRIDAAISRIEREIELINEYRTALISEVVTGKIDVRDRG
ncbi:restriction endonuclease subunit S [Armatimonas sp.]|uniref:restriction endonuclease subunit S n=1 Tax=Armatimonas sp. TaxID=1872638 RepID=UPI0037500F3A